MTQDELERLAARLRALLAEQGLAAVQAALAHQAGQLPPDQCAHLERMIFGADNQMMRSAPGHTAPTVSGTVTLSGGSIHGQVIGVNQGTIIAIAGQR